MNVLQMIGWFSAENARLSKIVAADPIVQGGFTIVFVGGEDTGGIGLGEAAEEGRKAGGAVCWFYWSGNDLVEGGIGK